MNKYLQSFLVLLFVFISGTLAAQVPSDYYANAEGKRGAELKSALFEIIKNPQVVSYADLWEVFQLTDSKRNNKVWDIYSDNPENGTDYSFDFIKHRCGSYRKEGDCYNREHTLPKSWYKKSGKLDSDLFHLYPTDGYVNNRRGNLPFGEVGIIFWESSNRSKIGQNTIGDYTEIVFEPIDAYKGDIARTFFYLVTAYEDLLPQWKSNQVGGNSYPGFSSWSLQLMLKWHREDPVSIKEVRRNEEIYKIQGNRNPYIDYPELVEYVWGDFRTTSFQSDSFLKIEYSPFERWLLDVRGLIKRSDQ